MKILIYDLEIIKAIPSVETIPGIEYCEGWRDFENMGISVCAYCYPDSLPIVFDWADEHQRLIFQQELHESDIISGFNSHGFDDNLLAANGILARTNYDILYECRLAAYGSTNYLDQPKGHSYKLTDIVAANGMEKTGRGDLAAIWWQQGERSKVREYCYNDALIERNTLKLLLAEKLINPSTGEIFHPRPLANYAY